MENLLSLNKKKQLYKLKGIKYKPEELKEEHDNDELNQVYLKRKYNKKKAFKIYAPPNSYQIDIIFLPKFKYANSHYDKILILIEITSKKAFAFPLKTNKMNEILDKMDELEDEIKINGISGDREFGALEFQKWCDKYNIDLYYDTASDDHISGGDKLGIVDRFSRTLKFYIMKNMIAHDNSNWLNDLQKIINFYNDTPHDALNGQTPNDISKDEWAQGSLYLDKLLYNHDIKKGLKFNIGDNVRVILTKGLHDKEGQTFSSDIYSIHDIVKNKYKVIDYDGKLLRRGFKPHELLKIDIKKLKPISKPVSIPKIINTQRKVRLLRKEGITNEEESKNLIDEVENPTIAEPVLRRSSRVTKPINRLTY